MTRGEMIKDIMSKDPNRAMFGVKYYKKFSDEQILTHWQKINNKPVVKTTKPNTDPTPEPETKKPVALSGFEAVNQ
ncbi:MAG: hypothetical protein WC389_10405 [Lutibacter sp.]|jgi:hypothetical protein